jgi:CheY-like chemotaxis protein
MPMFIHIIDSSKPSLVMTSEIFKDKMPGSIVTCSSNAKDALDHLTPKDGVQVPDVVVVDFDLPDADGVSLIREIRKQYKGPVFLTAFPSDVVKFAVSEELFHYNDSLEWVAKPVRAEGLNKKIEQFLINRFRLGKRFDVNFITLCVGKGEGRGKRAPKFDGRTTNISLNGAGVTFTTPTKLKIGDELVLTMAVPSGTIEGTTPLVGLKSIVQSTQKISKSGAIASALASKDENKNTPDKKMHKGKSVVSSKIPPIVEIQKSVSPPVQLEEYRIKAKVAWLCKAKTQAGLNFGRVTEQQKRQIESFLKRLVA